MPIPKRVRGPRSWVLVKGFRVSNISTDYANYLYIHVHNIYIYMCVYILILFSFVFIDREREGDSRGCRVQNIVCRV